MALPKIIWTYWEQGRHNAPPVIQRCFESWEYWNPGWTLHVLDRCTLNRYTDLEQRIDFSRDDITIQKRSNLIRVSLLRTHGGVWADATVMCLKWSGKIGQRAKMYPTRMNGYENDEETELFR